jgi:hypothetical protein
MGLIKVMITAVVLLSILGGTLLITRWGLERFIDFFLQRKVK